MVLAASVLLAVLAVGEGVLLYRLCLAYDDRRIEVLQFTGLFLLLLGVAVLISGFRLLRRIDRPSGPLTAGTLIALFTAIGLMAMEIGMLVLRFFKTPW